MKEVTMVYAIPDYIECPYCSAEQSGWIGDPRGTEVQACDNCGKEYKVSKYADVELR